jgi:hypothetical protein
MGRKKGDQGVLWKPGMPVGTGLIRFESDEDKMAYMIACDSAIRAAASGLSKEKNANMAQHYEHPFSGGVSEALKAVLSIETLSGRKAFISSLPEDMREKVLQKMKERLNVSHG